MSKSNLVEIDSLEALVIIDNELDPLSPVAPDTVHVSGLMGSLATGSPHDLKERGDAQKELRMEDICCSAHGLSILVTATRGDVSHSVLFDAGPEEDVWERNAKRLRADLASVEVIQLSHWHRDHSGGLLRAIRLINEAKQVKGHPGGLSADLHPSRPDYRGMTIGQKIISLQADPTFEEIEAAGAAVDKHGEAHTVLDDFFFVSGEIPRQTAYENGLKGGMRFSHEDNDWFSDELIADERFLMWKGIVMFTGCSHAGVVNAAKHAVESLDGSVPLHAVVGGFHLATSEEQQTESTVKDLKKLDPAVLLPGHCTGWRAKFAIERLMPGTLVPCTVGIKISF
ncbi:7, 8-dihydropterin-6-methyl-4-(beta-D-ribofuranosyl)-aminobenzene-5'- phosphate synthase [Aspergillus udagawae]|uniref:7, 8-dihydropterin-6-methyl-4-(Beta-D-ribofuranosyl)-aminobenzene-5'-phosphate synthase n=1 Tax=Aspergillus udagawae TaxID=91492 RepID=A0ABQ1BFI8_9EURO|nr:7, 8-dihydropterin-6-methyl-4-(beta-D-ribofuranosyl)-aminobenzene-5'- phosphate synthase [Aspergillus udagawae]GFG15705.1 7, 8-dihydropterin-6-methyl-4-(beta-D-ribofuranosyl)-aminobenzene-5'- phosphate synthase [Aspergillus udagawae]GFG20084.1 7, 8-dihydropterin-6-methyl-4-(beta-D-ribofuranosyl)-aminobenzene-5'- phosphate synthase [Aspergillus udagawae]